MKIVFSHLKKILPGLKFSSQRVANDLTLIGHFVSSCTKSAGDLVFDLEIRQNRGDCLGYYGIAKDLSGLYSLPIFLPEPKVAFPNNLVSLPIKVTVQNFVRRIMAIKISGLKNVPSPDWLKIFLSQHDINSINSVVDLTNYIMLTFGLPCHAFDAEKSTDKIEWGSTDKKETFVSFDGTVFELDKGTFVVRNKKEVLALPGIVGGKTSGIGLNTKEAIIEMAIYNREAVRLDAKKLKITTEASTRLEKDLDPELTPIAFKHLASLILANCNGKITTSVYDNYLNKTKVTKIDFDPLKPAAFAGIPISAKFSLEALANLGCEIGAKKGNIFPVTPPTIRKDIALEEDLVEEVVRLYGYERIPTNQPISRINFGDITPKILYLIDFLKIYLVQSGYDEIRSWPLVGSSDLNQGKLLPSLKKPIFTQNSINSEYPVLRMSIISSLETQLGQYRRYKLPEEKFFEISKVFFQIGEQYRELYSLGLFNPMPLRLNEDISGLAKVLKVDSEKFRVSISKDKRFAEVLLDDLLQAIIQIPKSRFSIPKKQATYELTRQIITMDANVYSFEKTTPKKIIEKYSKLVPSKYLWQITVTDIYQDEASRQYKYTLRVHYFNCDKETAKKIHQKVFVNLPDVETASE